MTAQPRPFDLGGRVVLITGASRGLGEALADAFGAAGAAVGLCARDSADVDAVVARLRAAGVRCHGQAADVTDAHAVRAWVDACTAQLGPPDALINNASLLGPRTGLSGYPLDEWRRVVDVNLTGTLICTQAVLAGRERREGRPLSIVNVSSGAAIPPREDWGAYAVSKQAVEGLSMNLAAELREAGVRVNVVDPGRMRTAMRRAAYPSEDPATLPPPESVVGVFLWLVSDESAGVTGQRFEAARWPGG